MRYSENGMTKMATDPRIEAIDQEGGNPVKERIYVNRYIGKEGHARAVLEHNQLLFFATYIGPLVIGMARNKIMEMETWQDMADQYILDLKGERDD